MIMKGSIPANDAIRLCAESYRQGCSDAYESMAEALEELARRTGRDAIRFDYLAVEYRALARADGKKPGGEPIPSSTPCDVCGEPASWLTGGDGQTAKTECDACHQRRTGT